MDDTGPDANSPAGWHYRAAPADGLLEVGTLRGSADGLAIHFHDELQITFVVAGRRRMHIAGRSVEIEAGRCACIPAGVPHGGLPETPGVAGLIAYAAAGDYDVPGLTRDVEALWRGEHELPWPMLAALVARRRRRPSHGALAAIPMPSPACMSREAFSRLFKRRMGMPPHAFEVARRLNAARRLLRSGEPIADVAAATRFADQSHLTRCFRRAFGVTPGLYGRSYRAITNVPDA